MREYGQADGAGPEVRVDELGELEVGAAVDLGAAEVGAGEVGPGEVCLDEHGVLENGRPEKFPSFGHQAGSAQDRSGEIGPC